MRDGQGRNARVAQEAERPGQDRSAGRAIAAFDLQFCRHPANIDVWTFGPVVVTVCRFARTGDLRPEISSYTFQGFLRARDTALS